MSLDPSPNDLKLVGLAPMAGRATRLGGIAGSKEILPVSPPGGGAPRAVCEVLLDAFAAAGVTRAYLVVRQGKWDIPACLGERGAAGVPLAYVVVEPTASVPATLDRAWPFVRGRRVALGFPDVLALPVAALAEVAARQAAGGADVVLGLFPTDRPSKADMVRADGAGRVVAIEVKPAHTDLRLTWLYAVWSPRFGAFLHDFVGSAGAAAGPRELQVSDVLMAALAAGLRVESVAFPEGSHLDVGTPDDLARAGGGAAGGAR
jgi:glucose-1-phosphate thymidylyltransferase